MRTRKFKDGEFFGQGSVFEITGLELKANEGKCSIRDLYPEVDLTGIKYAVLCTQDCDVDSSDKVTHINIALIEPIGRLKKDNPVGILGLNFKDLVIEFEEMKFYAIEDAFKTLKTRINQLIKNELNSILFLSIEEKYYYINLTKILPLKSHHLDSIKKRASFVLDKNFKFYLGWKLASLYGRVGIDGIKDDLLGQITTDILVDIGQGVREFWPTNSYQLNLEAYTAIKNLINNYNGKIKKGKPGQSERGQIISKLKELAIIE